VWGRGGGERKGRGGGEGGEGGGVGEERGGGGGGGGGEREGEECIGEPGQRTGNKIVLKKEILCRGGGLEVETKARTMYSY